MLTAHKNEGLARPVCRTAVDRDSPLAPVAELDGLDRVQAVAKGIALAVELGRISLLLERNNIPIIALKGPALAIQLYRSVSPRIPADLDIVLSHSHLQRAIQVLTGDGYRLDRETEHITGREYQRTLSRQSGAVPAVLDLHWEISPRERRLPFDVDEALRRAETVDCCGTPVRVLCGIDLFLYLCVHAAQHCWSDIKWLGDIAQCVRVRQNLEWPAVLDRAREYRCRRRVLVSAILARDLFGRALPKCIAAAADSDPMAGSLARRVHTLLLSEETPTEAQLRRIEASARDCWSDRVEYWLRFAWARMHPTRADRQAIPLPRSLGWLYYAIRPLRLICAHAGKAKFQSKEYASLDDD